MSGYVIIDNTSKGEKKYLRELPLMSISKHFKGIAVAKLKNPDGLTQTLRKAHVDATASEYRAWAVGWTVLLIVAFIPVAIMGILLLHVYFFAAFFSVPLVFYYLSGSLPSQWEKSLGKRFGGVNFITFLSLFNVFVSSGTGLDEVFDRIGNSEGFGAISLECKRIVVDVRSFGMDIMGAMQESAKYSPSEGWGNFLNGIVSSAKSGSSITHYVNSETAHATLEWDKEIEKTTESINVLSEVYSTVGNAMPLFLVFLIGIMSALGSEGASGPMDTLFLAIVIPVVLSVTFVWLFSSSVREGFS